MPLTSTPSSSMPSGFVTHTSSIVFVYCTGAGTILRRHHTSSPAPGQSYMAVSPTVRKSEETILTDLRSPRQRCGRPILFWERPHDGLCVRDATPDCRDPRRTAADVVLCPLRECDKRRHLAPRAQEALGEITPLEAGSPSDQGPHSCGWLLSSACATPSVPPASCDGSPSHR
jgi:hypothetical protein